MTLRICSVIRSHMIIIFLILKYIIYYKFWKNMKIMFIELMGISKNKFYKNSRYLWKMNFLKCLFTASHVNCKRSHYIYYIPIYLKIEKLYLYCYHGL